jgi:hypothetical protein
MSKEVRIIFAIFGGLGALLVAGIVALIFALPHLAKNVVAADSKAQASVAAKIATFQIPPGYRILTATDLGISQNVTIGREGARRGGFTIQLIGQKLPASSSDAEAGESIGLNLVTAFVKCDFKDLPDDVVKIRGKDVHFHVRACAGGAIPMRIESGTIVGNDPFTRVVAAGLNEDFDNEALHALLGSVR